MSAANGTGATVTQLTLGFNGEQWRNGGNVTAQSMVLEYGFGVDFTSVPLWTAPGGSFNWASPVATATAAAVDGNAAGLVSGLGGVLTNLNWTQGSTLWIRWIERNDTGNDHGLAIDNVTLSSASVSTTTVTLSVSSTSGSEAAGSAITVTATASAAVVGAQTVTLAVSETGVTVGDYVLSATTITIPAGQTSGSVTFTVLDDLLIEPTETATLTISNPSGGIVLGGTVSQSITIIDNDTPPTRIHDIQDAGHISPLRDQSVAAVPGIVTAVASNGFYMQDPLPDANVATSEAIFVFTNSAPTVAVGDSVLVSGTVFEFRPGGVTSTNLTTTEITGPVVTKLSSGNALPAAMLLGSDRVVPNQVIEDDASNVETSGVFDPANDGIDFWESLEGMLVQVNNPVTTSPTNSFGEIWVLPNNGAGASSVSPRGGSVVTATDFNPERLQLDNLLANQVFPTVDVGARLNTVTGVIDYSFSNFELRTLATPTVAQASTLQREVTALSGGTDLLRVATFNVENLDPSDGAAKFNALAAAIVGNLKSPDIINLEEVQDNNGATNNGVVDASVTLQTLVDAIATAGGPVYQWRQIDPANNSSGGEPGGNIRVVFLFDPARVSFVDGSLKNLNDTNLADGDAFASSRKPLVGDFLFNGETITLIGNHFNSKGGDGPLFGVTQPPVLTSEVQRLKQAAEVAAYVQQLQAANASAKVLVLGDLNDFEFSAPLTVLESAGLTSLIETLPANERYSYNFEGNAQTLDHIQASASLVTALRGFDVVHINSEFAAQVSDHDPVLAQFFIETAGKVVTGTRGRDTLVGGAGPDTIMGGQGRDVLTGDRGADTFVYSSLLDAGDVITDFTPGSDRLAIGPLLASVAYLGSNPVGDGLLKIVAAAGRSTVLFDPDGNAGAAPARTLVELAGVMLSDAAVLLDPSLFTPV